MRRPRSDGGRRGSACRLAALATLLGFCLGCAPAVQERVRDYSQDGLLLYQHGNYAAARDSFQAALELRPGDAALLYDLGQCHDRLGDPAKAELYYNQVLQRSPDHADCRYALCVLMVHQGRTPEAVKMVQDWMTQQPKQAAAYAADGWLWHQASDLPRAQARLQQALELDPHNCRALVELATVYEGMQRPERAVVLYERALDQNPDQPEVRQRLEQLRASGAGRPRPD
jgi:tetratricopeptide (TPR) repeat protein